MRRYYTTFFAIFLIVTNFFSVLYARTFKNVFARKVIRGNTLIIDNNVYIEGDLSVQGQVTNPSTLVGPASATLNAVVRFADATGKVLKNSSVLVDDAANITGVNQLTANTVNANLNGNATTATSATNFTGSLTGDVTGTQSATVVSKVGGQTDANVASATIAANAATSANTPNTIVRRDASGNFSAGTITAALIGAASLNVLKAGDTMTGALTVPAGTVANPAIKFTGSSSGTGFSAPSADKLSFDINGLERMSVDTTNNISTQRFIFQTTVANQGIEEVTPTTMGSVTAKATTSILLLINTVNVTNFTVTFPASPVNGQFFTIMLGTTNTVGLINNGGGASVVNEIVQLDTAAPIATTGGTAVTYLYSATANTWYRCSRG